MKEPHGQGEHAYLEHLRRELLDESTDETWPGPSDAAQNNAKLSTLSVESNTKDAFIAWLSRTGLFSQRELRRLSRIKLIFDNGDGRISLRQHGWDMRLVAALFASLGIASGLWVGWIIFGSSGNIQTIINSLALGYILGFLTSVVLDNSFRLEQMRIKILRAAPWLGVVYPHHI